MQGCISEYFQRIDELQERIDALNQSCDRINKNLASIQDLVTAIQTKDMVTGITEIIEDGVKTGYKINFVSHEPVTILNGKDGDKPLISSKYDSEDGNYYWTVQYGNGNVEWMLDPDGNKMLSIGVLPFLAIRDGKWYYTIDNNTYIEIGRAEGSDGDQMFKSFNAKNEDYVEITLSSGQKLKIPKYSAYLALKADFDKVNSNTNAQAAIIKATVDKIMATYLTRVQPIISGNDTIGTSFVLANGKAGYIYDWTSPMMPVIFAKAGDDGYLYWAYSYGDTEEQWVLSPDGNRISASSEVAEAPQVDVTLGDDGNWYWTVTYRGETEILRFPVGDGYAPHAIENEQNGAFSSVRITNDAMIVTLKGSYTMYSIPRQYSVSLTDESGKTVGETISMKAVSGGDVKRINYVAYGPYVSVSVFGEGGFTASCTKVNGHDCIEIHAPAVFTSGKVTALFTFGNDGLPVSVLKTFQINREN